MLKIHSINFIHFRSLSSTNDWVKENAKFLPLNQITCVYADEQTKGRGRFSRGWVSPKGQNMYATLYFTLPKGSPILPNISQILSISCVKVLEKHSLFPLIKWPNDLLLYNKKCAGVLCETVDLNSCLGIALGIGLNVNMSKEYATKIDQPATSLLIETGHPWSIDTILEQLLLQFQQDLLLLLQLGFQPFHSFYETHLAYKGSEIQVRDRENTIKGICHSVSTDGKLNLLLPNGQFLSIYTGDIYV